MTRTTRWTTAALATAVATALLFASGCSGDDDSASGDTSAATPSTTTSTIEEGAEEVAEEGASGSFTLLSYNVAGLPAEISSVDPAEHLPLISPLLNDYDIVATQEDFDWWGPLAANFDFVNYHDRLRADATHEFRTEQHPGPEAVGLDLAARMEPFIGDGLGVLSRLPIANTRRVPWDGCFGSLDTSDGGAADCAAMKGFLMTEVTLPSGDLVHLYDLHGEAGGSPTDQDLQVADYRQLATFIAEHSTDAAVIVAGDTNLHTYSDHEDASDGADTRIWEEFLASTGLTDSCDATSCAERDQIDKVAVRSGATVELRVESHRFVSDRFVDAAGEPLSDHPPLSVRIGWKIR